MNNPTTPAPLYYNRQVDGTYVPALPQPELLIDEVATDADPMGRSWQVRYLQERRRANDLAAKNAHLQADKENGFLPSRPAARVSTWGGCVKPTEVPPEAAGSSVQAEVDCAHWKRQAGQLSEDLAKAHKRIDYLEDASHRRNMRTRGWDELLARLTEDNKSLQGELSEARNSADAMRVRADRLELDRAELTKRLDLLVAQIEAPLLVVNAPPFEAILGQFAEAPLVFSPPPRGTEGVEWSHAESLRNLLAEVRTLRGKEAATRGAISRVVSEIKRNPGEFSPNAFQRSLTLILDAAEGWANMPETTPTKDH